MNMSNDQKKISKKENPAVPVVPRQATPTFPIAPRQAPPAFNFGKGKGRVGGGGSKGRIGMRTGTR